MIVILDIDLAFGHNHDHIDLDELLEDGFAIIGHIAYLDTDKQPFERFTLHKPNKAAAPKAATNELVSVLISTIKRDETKNNQRPMWRCTAITGEKVNIFLNVDEPEKDSFHLFQQAGWGNFLNGLALYAEYDCGIIASIRKNGQWWEIVSVAPNEAYDTSDTNDHNQALEDN